MQDLKDVTNNVHYENYRYNKLAPANTDGKIKPGSLTKYVHTENDTPTNHKLHFCRAFHYL